MQPIRELGDARFKNSLGRSDLRVLCGRHLFIGSARAPWLQDSTEDSESGKVEDPVRAGEHLFQENGHWSTFAL